MVSMLARHPSCSGDPQSVSCDWCGYLFQPQSFTPQDAANPAKSCTPTSPGAPAVACCQPACGASTCGACPLTARGDAPPGALGDAPPKLSMGGRRCSHADRGGSCTAAAASAAGAACSPASLPWPALLPLLPLGCSRPLLLLPSEPTWLPLLPLRRWVIRRLRLVAVPLAAATPTAAAPA